MRTPPSPPVPLGEVPRERPRIIRSLRHRNYQLFFSGQLVSLLGTFLTMTATGWLVLRLTHSAKMLGLVGFASQIPMFCLCPFAGVWVDRVNRQRLIITTQILAMTQSLAMAALALPHWINIWEILALSFFQGLINAFDIPARQAFLVEMVTDREDLANAIALNSTMVHLARVVGPAAAGLLIYWVGEGLCFTIDGFSYIAVICAMVAMKVAPRPPRPPRSVLHDLHEGFVYVWSFEPIRVLLILMAIISLTGIPALSTLMPMFGEHFGGSGPHGARIFGVLGTCSGAGALVGAIYLANRKSVLGLGRLIAVAAVTYGLAMIAFSFSRHLWLSLMIIPIAGWGMITLFAGSNTVLQTLADDDKRGRVMSFFTLAFIGMTPWGNLAAGYIATRLTPLGASPIVGAWRTVGLEGCICVVAALVFARRLPALRKVVRPVYVNKGILPEMATGLQAAANISEAGEEQRIDRDPALLRIPGAGVSWPVLKPFTFTGKMPVPRF